MVLINSVKCSYDLTFNIWSCEMLPRNFLSFENAAMRTWKISQLISSLINLNKY